MGIPDSLPHKLTLIQISRSSFSLPTDVILKLPGGNIEAHRSILAAVSPVFEKIFYGSCKEGKSMAVDLPKDSFEIMGLVIDFVYHGSCELKNLDDIFQILKVFNQYQINKAPFYHMCSEVILTRMESSNYLTLLQKFAKVMNEEGIRKAANKVMFYTNNDFIANFDSTKDLPEEVLLHLLQMNISNHEIDVFEFLVKWHDYQTKELNVSLQLTQQLFCHIRYSLIIPQILSSRVATRSDLVSSQLLGDAYHYIYNSCKPLGEYGDKECTLEPAGPSFRKPRRSQKVEWIPHQHNIMVQHNKLDECEVRFGSSALPINDTAMKSLPLQNGMYTFSVLNLSASCTTYDSFSGGYIANSYSGAPISMTICNQNKKYLYSYPLINNSLFTVYVHNEYLFLKFIEDNRITSTTSIMLEGDLYSLCICSLMLQDSEYKCSFSIHNHVQL